MEFTCAHSVFWHSPSFVHVQRINWIWHGLASLSGEAPEQIACIIQTYSHRRRTLPRLHSLSVILHCLSQAILESAVKGIGFPVSRKMQRLYIYLKQSQWALPSQLHLASFTFDP